MADLYAEMALLRLDLRQAEAALARVEAERDEALRVLNPNAPQETLPAVEKVFGSRPEPTLARRLGWMAEAMVSAKVGPQARFFTRERVDEIVVLLREAEKEILTLLERAALARVEAESEGRRRVLFEKTEELRREWQRAEAAEARCQQLEDALREVVEEYISTVNKTHDPADAANLGLELADDILKALSSPLPAPPQEPER